MAPPDDSDAGFTLIEMIIAMLIMALAIVAIVGALTSMSTLTSEHRAHAVTEVGARSFAEAVQQQAQFTTKLTAAVPAASAGDPATLAVADTSLMPRKDGTNTFVSIDREVMRVTAIPSLTSIAVVRDVNGDGAVAHLSATSVVPVLKCPTAVQLTPAPGTYETTTGVTSTLSAVQTWNYTTGAFEDVGPCLSAYDDSHAPCPVMGAVVLAECGSGLFRGTIDVTTPPQGRFRGVKTSTTVLLRTGGG